MPVPVVGVVEPGARAAAGRTKKKSVAVIGTETTIQSRSYEHAIRAVDASITVSGIACPLFVPLIEEGWLEGEIVTLTAERYLSPLKQSSADTIVLGCTHYPMLKEVIRAITGIALIDSAVETAREVRGILESSSLLRQSRDRAQRRYFVTDAPEKFVRTGEMFLGQGISNIAKISLEG
jgi:glutamate racemase